MLTFDWNGLRTGDHVLVHEPSNPDLSALRTGVVRWVEHHRRQTQVGIRIDDPSGGSVVWPSRLEVHSDPRDANEPCWRCAVPPT